LATSDSSELSGRNVLNPSTSITHKGVLQVNYCSKEPRESKLTEAGQLKYPGVVYVLRKMNERRRVKRELTVASIRLKVNEQSASLKTALADKDLPTGEIDRLNAQFGELLHGEWYPAWIRWGVDSISGLTIDGTPATIDSLCESGPSDLTEEIFLAVIAESGLSTPETKNLELPITSDAPVDGKTSSSIVSDATPPVGGEPETARSTTQAT
jgi:hypothetical protein